GSTPADARRRQHYDALMEPLYNPDGVEERWQQTWEAEGLYNADADDPRESFAIAHPPPNVTGDLHLGHALQLALADTIVRTRRMQGYNVLFQPGYDHAGISTQNAVEKHLAEQGKTRQDLGREAFVALVWEWRHEYGGKIMFQFRRIGASLDYRRERFTMDDAYVRAVLRFFVHLWNKDWLDRANRIVNRRVPVITDERVEMDFGTGALKITPGHDPTDYEIGRDHGLPELTVIGPEGRMNDEAGELSGLTQEEADQRILEWLREHDQLEKRESYRHTVALCDRCKSRIEPRISMQWWCGMGA